MMKQYFYLQSKRLWRILPFAVLTLAILLGCLLLGYTIISQDEAQKAENNKVAIGIVGSTDDPLLQMGLSALSQFESSDLSSEMVPMTEKEAKKALSRGQIAAYAVIPPDFMDEIRYGNVRPIKYVTNVGSSTLATIFQQEVTQVISQILLDAQKGVYGMYDAATENGEEMSGQMSEMPLEYTTYVVDRDKTLRITNLGISDHLGLMEYLFCGFCVVFLFLSCLPYAPMLITRDHALARMLTARGRSPFFQTVATFLAYYLCLLVTALTVFLIGCALLPQKALQLCSMMPALLVVVFMVCGFSYLLYCLSGDLIGGILVQFFTTLGMCFISGCLYPVYFFPSKVQVFATYLPAGAARSMLSGAFTKQVDWLSFGLLIGYGLSFFLMGSLITCRKVKEVRQ